MKALCQLRQRKPNILTLTAITINSLFDCISSHSLFNTNKQRIVSQTFSQMERPVDTSVQKSKNIKILPDFCGDKVEHN